MKKKKGVDDKEGTGPCFFCLFAGKLARGASLFFFLVDWGGERRETYQGHLFEVRRYSLHPGTSDA